MCGPGASERGSQSRAWSGRAGGLTAFVFFAQANRASRRAASPTTARPGKTITKNRVSALAFPPSRPAQSPEPVDFIVRASLPPFFFNAGPMTQCRCTFVSRCPCVCQRRRGVAVCLPLILPFLLLLGPRGPGGGLAPQLGGWGPLSQSPLTLRGQDADQLVSSSLYCHCRLFLAI